MFSTGRSILRYLNTPFLQSAMYSARVSDCEVNGYRPAVAQQPIQDVEVAVDHRLIAAVFEGLDLGLDRGVAHGRLPVRGGAWTHDPCSRRHALTIAPCPLQTHAA